MKNLFLFFYFLFKSIYILYYIYYKIYNRKIIFQHGSRISIDLAKTFPEDIRGWGCKGKKVIHKTCKGNEAVISTELKQ